MKKYFLVMIIILVNTQSVLAAKQYSIEAAVNDETFIINGEVFKAKTYCFNVEKDDKVIFTDGSASGTCTSAEFLNLRTSKTCRVWCE